MLFLASYTRMSFLVGFTMCVGHYVHVHNIYMEHSLRYNYAVDRFAQLVVQLVVQIYDTKKSALDIWNLHNACCHDLWVKNQFSHMHCKEPILPRTSHLHFKMSIRNLFKYVYVPICNIYSILYCKESSSERCGDGKHPENLFNLKIIQFSLPQNTLMERVVTHKFPMCWFQMR